MAVNQVKSIFVGLFGLLGLGAAKTVSKVSQIQKDTEYEAYKQKLERERVQEEDARNAWYKRVIDDNLEYQLRLAVLRGEQWACDEIRELIGDRTQPFFHKLYVLNIDDMVKYYEELYHKKASDAKRKELLSILKWRQNRAEDVLLANRGKLRREYVLKGVPALGGMKDAEDLKLREQHIEFVNFLDSLLKQHGITENLTFRDWYGHVSPPGCRLGNPGVYTYHPEFILFTATDPTAR